jgi:GT2 family glycosyltransferase
MSKFVSIITPNFNGEKYLKKLFDSVLSSSYKNFKFLIVDDGSNDNSMEIIKHYKKIDKRIKLFKNPNNIGAAASRNKAIKKAAGDIIVFLDNDTEVTDNWLGELIKPLNKKGIGASQALLIDINDRDTIQMAGGKLIPQVAWLAPFFHRVSYKKNKKKLKQRGIVAISAALAVKREALDVVKGFDEMEAVTTEDLDFCWRIWLSGYRIVLAPKSIVYHWTKDITERENMKTKLEDQYFHLAKNSFRSIIKNYEITNLIKYLTLSIFINVGRGVYFLTVRRNKSSLMGSIKAIFWSIKHAANSFQERKAIQKSRKLEDKVLMDRVFDNRSLIQIYNSVFRGEI